VVGLPGLERAAGNIEQLGCLPMGEPLRLQIAIALKQFSASVSLPAWVTIVVASLLILDDGSHGYLLVLKPRSSGDNKWLRIWRGSLLIATLNEVEILMSWSRQLGQVAGAVIEASRATR
jgi:hypothetical protein